MHADHQRLRLTASQQAPHQQLPAEAAAEGQEGSGQAGLVSQRQQAGSAGQAKAQVGVRKSVKQQRSSG